jgi:sulfate adenylyltransferase large subunit
VQTRRHSYICSLLGIKHFVVAINKMDLVDYSQARFDEIQADFEVFVAALDVPDVHYVPMSALLGENVVNSSTKMPWYSGDTMLALLDTLPIQRDAVLTTLRLPVQYVNRPNLDFRGFCGTVAAGRVTPGMAIKALPSGKISTVKSIVVWEGELTEASTGQAITLTLNDEIDISRGDMIIAADDTLTMAHNFEAHLVWMHEQPLHVGKIYDFKLGTTFTSGRVTEIIHQIDVNTLTTSAAEQLPLNGIALCRVQLTRAVAFDAYKDCRATGSLIVIDRLNNITVGAGMIQARLDASDDSSVLVAVSAADRARRLGQTAVRIVIEASGAHALAEQVESALFSAGALAAIASDSVVIEALQGAGVMVIVPEEVVGERSMRIRDAAASIAPQQLVQSNTAAAAQVVALLREQQLLG